MPVPRWLLGLASWLLVLGLVPAVALGSPLPFVPLQNDRATLTILSGTATLVHADSGAREEIADNASLVEGDRVITSNPGSALITFVDGSEQELDAGTEIQIVAVGTTSGGGTLTILAQAVGVTIDRVADLTEDSTYQVETPLATAVVRGTVFRTRVLRDAATEELLEVDFAAVQDPLEVQTILAICTLQPGQVLRFWTPEGIRRGLADGSPEPGLGDSLTCPGRLIGAAAGTATGAAAVVV